MPATPIDIRPIFAAPLATLELAEATALNRELETLFLARETEDYRNPDPTHVPQAELFESDFNLFHWSEPCVQALRRFMLGAVGQVAAELNGYSREDMARLSLQAQAWFHITRPGGAFVAHNHPMASWSAVYCVRAGEPSAERRDSGVLRFLDQRPGANMYLDAGNARLRQPYSFGHFALRLKAGQLVIFPAYLMHEVAAFMGDDLRITVAANCWFPRPTG